MCTPVLTLFLTIAALLLSSGIATAVQLKAVYDAPIYDSAGTQVGWMPAGAIYEGTCDVNYCYVDTVTATDGWVPVGYLVYPAPGEGMGDLFSLGYQIGIAFGGGDATPGTPPPAIEEPEAGEVCFFDRPNFGGRSFCVGAGESADRLPRSWNDRISSISVGRGLSVSVCRDADYEGSCADYDSDIARLPNRLNDRVSSFEVDG